MSLLASILSVLRARWFWSLVGAIIISLLIWFYGDIIGVGETHPLITPVSRLVVVLGIAVVWGLWNVLAQARARRSNDKLVTALAQPARDRSPANGELAELERRFSGALDQLKRGRLGKKGNRRWLYELPWYVMIGPPGSGKSTALAQSGLRLRLGQIQELRGVGGTRYCDWIFTDEAVLLDTAGRYTTQDSDPGADKAAWFGFLDLLKQRRPRYPLNGVLVALATRDLLQDGGADHAATIRARLEEIETRLGMRLPVYLVVTKADLVAGFEPFFDRLNETEREQVWGYTFDYKQGDDRRNRETVFDPAEFSRAWADLVARLDHRLPERLAAEPDVGRRSQIFAFPAQVASLGDEIVRFVPRCFQASSYERGGWLRGIYLTSGTQTGTPIDRLMAAVAQSIGAKVAPPAGVGGDRSFFLRRLLEGVIFNEANIAGRDLSRERRDTWWRTAAIASIAFVALVTIGGWGWSFAGNRERYDTVEKDLAAWSQDARPFSQTRLTQADADFSAVLPLLNRLDTIRSSLYQNDTIDLRLGLSQRSTVGTELDAAYRTALIKLLLPRLFLAAQRDLRARIQDPDYLAIGLKVYLSLAGSAPVDVDLLRQWFTLDLQGQPKEVVASATRHVSAVAAILPELDAKDRPVPDGALLAQGRVAFGRISLPKRAYAALMSNPAITALPAWKITEHSGPSASTALVRRSGRLLDYPVPAIFTYDGFYQVFMPQLDGAARGTYAEYWILTGRGTPEASDDDIRKTKADMLRLYYDDAIAAWDGLLHDITVAPINTLDEAVETTKALSGPSSPLKLLIQAVVHETSLTVQPEPAQADEKNPVAAAMKAAGKLNSSLSRLAQLIRPAAADAAPTEVPGAPVEAHFAYLRRLVQGEKGAPPALDDAIAALGSLNVKLSEVAASPNPGEAFARMGNAAPAQLALAARALPDPLKQMLDGVQRKATDMGRSGVRQQMNAVWLSDVLPFCQTAISDRFPFVPTSSTDAAMDDVVRLFGTSGLIESFIKGQLTNFVDTTRRPWRDSQNIGLSSDTLEQLSRAHRITMALFAAGASPKATFSVSPLSLDNDSASVALNVDGQEVRYAHGPPQWTTLTWPGLAGTNTVRVNFVPFGGGPPVTDVSEGPWALFRMLHKRNFQATGQPDVFETEVGAGTHNMRLRLRAASVENPFDLRLLSGFTCPGGL
jgi:type VI secretion system protein ImpL